MKIGIFGYYHLGNFGDDLMAVLIAKRIQDWGHDVLLYGLDDQISQEFDLPCTKDMGSFVESTDLVVYGGGGVFVGEHRGHGHSSFDETLDRLLACSREIGREIYGISLGGDGVPLVNKARLRLLEQASQITFRNEQDASLVEARGREESIYPDIVWNTAEAFHAAADERSDDGKLLLLFDSAGGKGARKVWKKLLFRVVEWLSCLPFSKLRLRRVNLNLRSSQRQAADKGIGSRYAYRQLGSTLNFISRADAVVASRLHFSMVALSYGKAALLVDPLEKSRIVFDRYSLGGYVYSSLKLSLLLAYSCLFPKKLKSRLHPANRLELTHLGARSDMHFDELRKFVHAKESIQA